MALPFNPNPGLIVICDFDGMKEPEMTKRRPAIVVSPRSRTRAGLCTILPISCTAPQPELAHHFRLTLDPTLPDPYPEPEVWVKCDMVYSVGYHRLNLPFYKDVAGNRQYINQFVAEDDLLAIRRCMLSSLGFAELAKFL